MKLFALHISYSTLFARIRIGEKHADPCGSGSETLERINYIYLGPAVATGRTAGEAAAGRRPQGRPHCYFHR